ncbi:MAG: hypothetical protein SV201_05815 [Pseudomonadota bacterium]|nr:hypothetical protein [Pseudomonadota bacterium]
MQHGEQLPPHIERNMTNDELVRHYQFSDEPMVSALVQRLDAGPSEDELAELEDRNGDLSVEIDTLESRLKDYEGYDEDLTALDDVYPPLKRLLARNILDASLKQDIEEACTAILKLKPWLADGEDAA